MLCRVTLPSYSCISHRSSADCPSSQVFSSGLSAQVAVLELFSKTTKSVQEPCVIYLIIFCSQDRPVRLFKTKYLGALAISTHARIDLA